MKRVIMEARFRFKVLLIKKTYKNKTKNVVDILFIL